MLSNKGDFLAAEVAREIQNADGGSARAVQNMSNSLDRGDISRFGSAGDDSRGRNKRFTLPTKGDGLSQVARFKADSRGRNEEDDEEGDDSSRSGSSSASNGSSTSAKPPSMSPPPPPTSIPTRMNSNGVGEEDRPASWRRLEEEAARRGRGGGFSSASLPRKMPNSGAMFGTSLGDGSISGADSGIFGSRTAMGSNGLMKTNFRVGGHVRKSSRPGSALSAHERLFGSSRESSISPPASPASAGVGRKYGQVRFCCGRYSILKRFWKFTY